MDFSKNLLIGLRARVPPETLPLFFFPPRATKYVRLQCVLYTRRTVPLQPTARSPFRSMPRGIYLIIVCHGWTVRKFDGRKRIDWINPIFFPRVAIVFCLFTSRFVDYSKPFFFRLIDKFNFNADGRYRHNTSLKCDPEITPRGSLIFFSPPSVLKRFDTAALFNVNFTAFHLTIYFAHLSVTKPKFHVLYAQCASVRSKSTCNEIKS